MASAGGLLHSVIERRVRDMRIYLAAIALTGTLLVGCSSDWDPARAGKQKTSVDATQESKRPVATLATRRSTESFASLPDRGELLSYSKDREVRRSGAYTSYPVEISEEHALNAIAAGGIRLVTPEGKPVNVEFRRIEEHADGNWTWVGESENGDHAVLTFGERAVFGEFSSARRSYRVTTRRGNAFVVETDPLQLANHPGHHGDGPEFLIPPDTSSSAAGAAGEMVMAAADASVAAKAATAVIDLALGFTPGMVATYGSEAAAVSRLTNLVALGNFAYERSGVNMRVRLVHAMRVEYPDNTDNADALQKLTGYNSATRQFITPDAAFNGLRAAREQYGADLVALVRQHRAPEQKGCGIAWLIGANQRAITAADAPFGYSVVSDGSDLDESDNNTYFCSEYSLVHELGHNMGQAHNQQNSEYAGAHAYSYGYREAASNGFHTIMAYPLADSSQTEVPYFSTPLISLAAGRPYGLASSADNVRSLNQTMPIVATFRQSIVPASVSGTVNMTGDFNGDGWSDIVMHDSVTGSFIIRFMSGAQVLSQREYSVTPGYQIHAIGDFNGDGRSDLIFVGPGLDMWQWVATGAGNFTIINSGSFASGWALIGSGDVNGDGVDDLIFHSLDGFVRYLLMAGSYSYLDMSTTVTPGYTIAAIMDTDGDGRQEIVWRGPSRDLWRWKLGTGNIFQASYVGVYAQGWTVVGGIDISGDGVGDLILHNPTSGRVGISYFSAGVPIQYIENAITLGYRFAGSGRFNSDSRADILWTSAASDLWLWLGSQQGFVANYVGVYDPRFIVIPGPSG